jgi:hypothetical protein
MVLIPIISIHVVRDGNCYTHYILSASRQCVFDEQEREKIQTLILEKNELVQIQKMVEHI